MALEGTNRDLWAINDQGELVHWRYDSAKQEMVPREPFFFRAAFIEGRPGEEGGLVAEYTEEEPWPSAAAFYKPVLDRADADKYTPLSVSEQTAKETAKLASGNAYPKVPDRYKNRDGIVIIDEDTVFIDDEVDIEEGTPDNPTIIGPGTKLTGKTKVKAGAQLYRAKGVNAIFGEDGSFDNVEAIADPGVSIEFGQGCKFKHCSFHGAHRKSIKVGSEASGINAMVFASERNIEIGKEATLFTYARVMNSSIGAKSKIGCKVWNSNIGTGVTVQHVATRIYNADVEDTDVANATNIAAGAIVGRKGATSRVKIGPSVFIGTNTRIEQDNKGDTIIGEGSYVVGKIPVKAGAKLLPFTFCQAGDGKIAGVFDAPRLGLGVAGRYYTGYPLRYGATAEQKNQVNFRLERRLAELAETILSTEIPHVPGAPDTSVLSSALSEAIAFIRQDLAGQIDLSREERIQERNRLFAKVISAIGIVKEDAGGPYEFNLLLSRLEVVCSQLQDGRFRMRDGVHTDACWYNKSRVENVPDLEVIQYTEQNIRSFVGMTRLDKLGAYVDAGLLSHMGSNVRELGHKAIQLNKQRTEQIGLGISGKTILEHMGARESMEELAKSRLSDGKTPLCTFVVYAENEREKRVIERLRLPNVAEVVVLQEGLDRAGKINTVTERLAAHGITDRRNIGMIEDPTDSPQAVIAELQALNPDIFIGVMPVPQEGQMLSVHAAFLNVINAVTSQDPSQPHVFAIRLPAIEHPSVELQQKFEEYLEAIEFLKNA